MITLGPKINNLPHFGHNNNFPQKMGSVMFMCLFNPTFMKKSEKGTELIMRKG